MFEELFHKLTFGIFRKKDNPSVTQTPAQQPQEHQPQEQQPQEQQPQGQQPQGQQPRGQQPQGQQPQEQGSRTINATSNLKSSDGGSQVGGGHRRRRGSRRKDKKGGFNPGGLGHQAMGVGHIGGKGRRQSKKKNTHKRRK